MTVSFPKMAIENASRTRAFHRSPLGPPFRFVACRLQTDFLLVHTFLGVPRDDTSAPVVGQVLCEAREHAGLTQEEVAVRAKMDRSYVSDIERGTSSLSVDRLLRLCQAMGVSPGEIISRIEKRLR